MSREATLPADEARGMLADPVTIIAVLSRLLLERGSPYAAVFGALEELAGVRPDEETLEKANGNVLLQPEAGLALDQAWQDTEVIFGPGQSEANCNSCSPMPPRGAAPAAHP